MRGDGATNPVFHIHWWICRRSPKVTVKFIFCWLYSLSKSLYFCYWGFLCVWVGYLESNVVLLEFQVRTCELRSGTDKIWTWQIFKKLLGLGIQTRGTVAPTSLLNLRKFYYFPPYCTSPFPLYKYIISHKINPRNSIRDLREHTQSQTSSKLSTLPCHHI